MSSNPATQTAESLLLSLAQAGLTDVCVSPGSRSTPLTLAAEAHPGLRVHIAHDERSGGFLALGIAIATDRPVALVCTSGTAGANYLPAIIEAQMSHVPLLILTSDRPPELRHSGANQTIDQVKFFGDQVLWSVDVALPEADPPPVARRNLETLAARAYAKANGLRKGPVHLNLPFRKPLEPAEGQPSLFDGDPRDVAWQPKATISRGVLTPSAETTRTLATLFSTRQRGLIVCGPRCPTNDAFISAVTRLAAHLNYPIVADPTSGLRFQTAGDPAATIVSSGETLFQQEPPWEPPQIVVRFGAVPISKWVNAYLDTTPIADRIHIRESGVWADDSHRTTWLLQANETATCKAILAAVAPRPHNEWHSAVAQSDLGCWQAIEAGLNSAEFDGGFVADTVALTPPDATLFVGNSLPIRHLDQFARAQPKALFAYASRGASGIDGNISTALGIHLGRGQKLVAVLGDITFYHDMNGLLAISQGNLRDVVLVVVNNDGGGIFSRLPIARHDPPFGKLFTTPHGLTFKPAAELYGLAYTHPQNRAEFRTVLTSAVAQSTPTLIEVTTTIASDEAVRRQINAHVANALKES